MDSVPNLTNLDANLKGFILELAAISRSFNVRWTLSLKRFNLTAISRYARSDFSAKNSELIGGSRVL